MEADVATDLPFELAVLLRYVEYDDVDPEHRVDVKAVYQSESSARSEAERLNALPQSGPRLVRYFVKVGTSAPPASE
jgi:hypothetical protein